MYICIHTYMYGSENRKYNAEFSQNTQGDRNIVQLMNRFWGSVPFYVMCNCLTIEDDT